MPLYFSGKGDSGETNLFGGSKVPKDNPTVELLGIFDHLSAQIGLAISLLDHGGIKNSLLSIQIVLSKIMGLIAGANETHLELESEIDGLEKLITKFGNGLDQPKDFVYPCKTETSALINLCRTHARTVERRTLSYSHETKNFDRKIIIYLNRLSSLLYVLSLFLDQGKEEK